MCIRDRVKIYTPTNQIPGYAPGQLVADLDDIVAMQCIDRPLECFHEVSHVMTLEAYPGLTLALSSTVDTPSYVYQVLETVASCHERGGAGPPLPQIFSKNEKLFLSGKHFSQVLE